MNVSANTRPTHPIRAILVFTMMIVPLVSIGAGPRRYGNVDQAPELNEHQAAEYLSSMQTSTFAETYVFRFKLKHYPYRERTITNSGTIYGVVDTETGIQYERILIQKKDSSGFFKNTDDFLLIRSSNARVFKAQSMNADLETETNANFKELTSEELAKPILENQSLTYFDLLAPYLHWNDFEYLGPEQVKARPTQSFRLINPDEASEMNSVKLQLDDEFKAVLKAEFENSEQEVVKKMELIALKNTKTTSLPKTIDYRETRKRGSKSRIDIIAAATNIQLPVELFDPQNLGYPLPEIEYFVYDVF